MRFAEFARKHPYEVRFIEFMPLDGDRSWSRDRVLPNAEVRRLIHAAYPLEGPRPRAPRHVAALGVRRRPGLDRLHLAGHRAVLRRLQPHPRDRRGQAAHLPVLDDRDRPARAAARRRLATPSSSGSSATPCGRRSSSTTSTTRASCRPPARCRRSADEGLRGGAGADPRGDRAARGRDRAAARRRAARDRRRGACRDRPPAVRPHGDGRVRGARRGRHAGRGAEGDRRPGGRRRDADGRARRGRADLHRRRDPRGRGRRA